MNRSQGRGPWSLTLAEVLLAASLAPLAHAAEGSPRLSLDLERALGLDESLTLEVDFRARYEFLDEQFRAGRAGEDEILALRTRLRARWQALPWLASDRDAWTTSGVRDPSGRSGGYVGSQLELSLRWQVVPENLRFEFGYAHLSAGRFIDDAPNSNRQGDSNYVYTQLAIGL